MSFLKHIECESNKVLGFFAHNPSAIFLLWAIWLTSEYIFLGPFSYIRMHDEGDSILPMRLAQVIDFAANGFSYWFPYAACGTDRLAATYKIFQLDSLLFFIFPGWLAYGLIILIQRFIAGYFTFRLCKDYLGRDIFPSIIAGLAYAISFSALLYGVAHHSIMMDQFAGMMGFPLILWLLEYMIERSEKSVYLMATALGFFVLFSASFVITLPFILPMILVWFIFIRHERSLKFFIIYIIFTLIILLGNIPLIQALLANAPLSHRAQWPVFGTLGGFDSSLDASIISSVRFILGNSFYFFIGILGLLWIRFEDKRYVIITGLAIFCGAIVSLIKPLWTYFFVPHLGFLSGYQFDRFYLLAPFFTALMVGFGLHFFMRDRTFSRGCDHESKKLIKVKTVSCIIVLLFLVMLSGEIKVEHAAQWMGGDSYAINYENSDLDHLSKVEENQPYRVATVAHDLHPGFANAYGFESADGYVTLYTFRYQNFWGKVIEPLTSNDSEIFNYYHNWGNRIYLFAPSNDRFDLLPNIPFSDYYNLDLLSLANVRYIISRKLLVSEDLILLPSQMSEHAHPFGQGKVAEGLADNLLGRKLFIYRNDNCLPRFFVVSEVKRFENSTQLLKSLSRADLGALRSTAFVETESFPMSKMDVLGFADGNIIIEKYSPDRIDLNVGLNGSGIMIVTNSYSPYWRCLVDGVERSIFPVDATFCGIYLQGDEMNVTLKYDPPYRSFY